MWLADNWEDYAVLECSRGEKLERWGKYILVRPDPQVIWDTPRTHEGWKTNNGVYHRSDKGGGSWELRGMPNEWSISYGELMFRLKPFQFKHTGLFPEQAANWEWFVPVIEKEAARRGTGEPVRVLNLFAYTGGATLAATAAGAIVTHVDASKGMVQWAKENYTVSGFERLPARFLVDDCSKFVKREIRRGKKYDAVILDPPSYGRGPDGEIWKLEDQIYGLLKDINEVICDDPVFFLLNSYTTGLQPLVLKDLMSLTICAGRGGKLEADELGLGVEAQDIALPCGCSARWRTTS